MLRWGLPLVLLSLLGGTAVAGKNDFALLNFCKPETPAAGRLNGSVPECSWIVRSSDGRIDQHVHPTAEAESRFRSLMSEMGVVMAPRLQSPADTLGFSGFQVSAEVAMTQISRDEPFWDGVEGVSAQNPLQRRPDAWLATVGAFARKGIWLPLPAFEIGAGAVHLLESQMVAVQGYAKFALHEGFHDWALPSLAVRGSVSRVTGTDQVALTIGGVDVSVSKQFGLGGTARFEPYGGWNLLFVHARSKVLDATPACDAYLVNATTAPEPGQLGNHCSDSQAGTFNDLQANFVFPDQDAISRHRLFGGFKLKFGVLAVTGQYDFVAEGGTRDEQNDARAKDDSSYQQTVSFAAALDF